MAQNHMSGFAVIFSIFLALTLITVSCLTRFARSGGEDTAQLLIAIAASIPASLFALFATCEALANDE